MSYQIFPLIAKIPKEGESDSENVNALILYLDWFKGTVHPQVILLKYVMVITVNKNCTIIIKNYTWYHRYKEII